MSKIDIRQFSLKISTIDGKVIESQEALPDAFSADKRNMRIRVEIGDNNSESRPGISKGISSDVRDIRLFRNGSLVRLWDGNAFKMTEKDGCKQIPATEDSPRKAICETDVLSVVPVFALRRFSSIFCCLESGKRNVRSLK